MSCQTSHYSLEIGAGPCALRNNPPRLLGDASTTHLIVRRVESQVVPSITPFVFGVLRAAGFAILFKVCIQPDVMSERAELV